MLTQRGGFSTPVKLIVFSVILSMPMAYLSWGQGFRDSIIETTPSLIWILFFLLVHYKIPIKTIESIALICGLLYVLLFFFQLANSPTVLFGRSLWGEEFTVDRNVTRIIFPAAGVFIFTVFMAISKLTTQKKHRWFWIVLVVLGVLVPIIQVTRQFTMGILIFYLIHFIRRKNIIAKLAIAAGFFLVLFIAIMYSKNPMIEGMVSAQQRDLNLGSDYVRVQAGKYFLTDFSPNFVSRIFGNGMPNWGFSSYGIFVENLAVSKGYFHSDVGIIAVYSLFGVMAVIGYVLIWIKSFTVKVPEKYIYVKYYLWYLLLTSLTWFSVYSHHYLISTVFILYIYHTIEQRTYTINYENDHLMKVFIPMSSSLTKTSVGESTRDPGGAGSYKPVKR